MVLFRSSSVVRKPLLRPLLVLTMTTLRRMSMVRTRKRTMVKREQKGMKIKHMRNPNPLRNLHPPVGKVKRRITMRFLQITHPTHRFPILI